MTSNATEWVANLLLVSGSDRPSVKKFHLQTPGLMTCSKNVGVTWILWHPATTTTTTPQQVFQHIYIWSDRRAFSAVKSRTGYSTRMFLASPAKQFLTTSACLPAGLPAIETFNGAHQWFYFVASSMNTYFNITYVARVNLPRSNLPATTWCHHSPPQASREW